MTEEDFDVRFTCELCGEKFEPTPDAMIEWEMGPQWVKAKSDSDIFITHQDLMEMDNGDLKAVGITPEQRDAMLRGETVKMGGCICLRCQDEFSNDAECDDEDGIDY